MRLRALLRPPLRRSRRPSSARAAQHAAQQCPPHILRDAAFAARVHDAWHLPGGGGWQQREAK